MKKLLIISLNSDPVLSYGTEHNGGQSKYVLELSKNLVKKGWFIDVYTIKNSNSSITSSVTEGFEIYRFPLPGFIDYSYNIDLKDIDFISKSIIDFISKNNKEYSLVLCCYWLSGLVGMKLKEENTLNTLISFCSLGFFKMEAKGESKQLKKRIEFEKKIADSLDHIIATSCEEKKILINKYSINSRKITVIPRGVDTKKFFNIEKT